MAATLTLLFDDQTSGGFRQLLKNLEAVENETQDVGEAADDAADKYRKLSDESRRMIRESLEGIGQKDGSGAKGGSGLVGGITAVSVATLAVSKGFQYLGHAAQEAWEAIQAGAAAGDVQLQQLEQSIRRSTVAWDEFKVNLVSGAANDLPWLDDFMNFLAGVNAAELEINRNLDRRLAIRKAIDGQLRDQTRQEQIAALQSMRAIDERIAAVRLELGSRKETVVSEEEMLALGRELLELEQRRRQLLKQEAEEDKKRLKEEHDRRQKMFEDGINKRVEAERRYFDYVEGRSRGIIDLQDHAAREFREDIRQKLQWEVDRLEEIDQREGRNHRKHRERQGEIEKKLRTLHELRLTEIEKEANARLLGAQDNLEVQRVAFETLKKLNAEEAQFERQLRMRRLEDAKRAADIEIELAKRKTEELKKALAGEQGDAKSAVGRLLNQQSSRAVLEGIVRQRMQQRQEADPDMTEFERRRAARGIRRQVIAQANRGLFTEQGMQREMLAARGPEQQMQVQQEQLQRMKELRQAQAENAAAFIQQARQRGQLDQQTANTLGQAAAEMLKLTADQEEIRSRLDRVQALLDQRAERAQRSRSQRAGLRG